MTIRDLDRIAQAAACRGTDTEAFFPEVGGSTREAKRVCVGCEVRADCLDYALAARELYGIWGGLGPDQRRHLARHRALTVTCPTCAAGPGLSCRNAGGGVTGKPHVARSRATDSSAA